MQDVDCFFYFLPSLPLYSNDAYIIKKTKKGYRNVQLKNRKWKYKVI